jgi:hypothetical protein
MKKLFSLVLLTFAIFFSASVMAAQPKAEEIIGKWQVHPEYVSKILGELPQEEMGVAQMECCFEFCDNAKAKTYIKARMQFAVDDGIEMILDFDVLLDCSWQYDDAKLFAQYDNIDVTMNEIKLQPENTEFEMLMQMMKPQVLEKFSSMIKESFNNEPLMSGDGVDIEGDKMTIIDSNDGDTLVLMRIVE